MLWHKTAWQSNIELSMFTRFGCTKQVFIQRRICKTLPRLLSTKVYSGKVQLVKPYHKQDSKWSNVCWMHWQLAILIASPLRQVASATFLWPFLESSRGQVDKWRVHAGANHCHLLRGRVRERFAGEADLLEGLPSVLRAGKMTRSWQDFNSRVTKHVSVMAERLRSTLSLTGSF